MRVTHEPPGPASPLVLQWGEPHESLPLMELIDDRRQSSAPQIPPWIRTGPESEPFDFCASVRRLCDDIALRCEDLSHVRTERVLFAITRARNSRAHGLQARVTPLRFRGGRLVRRHRGVSYQVQRHLVAGREVLYLMTFCLPRFLNQIFDDKLVTVFHEMYHISPAFDGDLRRHAGRCSMHTSSRRRYDDHMAALARRYLGSGPDPDLHAFLRLDSSQLLGRHRRIVGIALPRPKLIPVLVEAASCSGS